MRYITNQLGWQHDSFAYRTWVDHQGNSLAERFCFGGTHDWQAPSGKNSLFASEPLTIEMARSWIGRDQFISLVAGQDVWATFLSALLQVEVPKHQFDKDKPDHRFLISREDVVLRIGFKCTTHLPDKWHGQHIEDLNDSDLIGLLKYDQSLIRFYLHFVRDFNPASVIHYDAGL